MAAQQQYQQLVVLVRVLPEGEYFLQLQALEKVAKVWTMVKYIGLGFWLSHMRLPRTITEGYEMSELTSGQRATRCLTGEDIDRVPFGIGIGWHPWAETLRVWQEQSGDPDLDYGNAVGLDSDWALPRMNFGIFPVFETEIIEETDEYIVHRNEHGITVRDRKDRGSIPEYLDYPVKNSEDWERLKAERLSIDVPGRFDMDWDAFRAEIEESGAGVQLGHYPYGIFGTPRDLLGAEELLVAFYDKPEMIQDIMETLTSLWLALYERATQEVKVDQIHIWEDMSGRQGSLISPSMVEKFMMPCYDRIATFAREHDIPLISVDTDGDCSMLVPLMMKHGVNVFFPFEVQAGNDILEYREKYPELGIIGGLDKRALAGKRDDIDRQVEKAAKMIEKGRYVPGFDHLIPPDATWENYCYAAEEIKKVCYGMK